MYRSDAGCCRTDRRSAREPARCTRRRDHHLAVVGRRASVHAIEEALCNAILQRNDAMRALVPLRKASVHADEAAASRLCAAVDVAGVARHVGAHVLACDAVRSSRGSPVRNRSPTGPVGSAADRRARAGIRRGGRLRRARADYERRRDQHDEATRKRRPDITARARYRYSDSVPAARRSSRPSTERRPRRESDA